MPLKTAYWIVALCLSFMVLAPGATAQQADPFAQPKRAWEQAPIYRNTIPTEFETHIIAATEADRATAQRIIDLYKVFETNPTIENVGEYVSDRYIQHSAMLPNGKAPLAMLFSGSVAEHPAEIDVHKVIVVGNWAMAHVNFRNLEEDSPKDKGIAAVDMYLFDKDGKITEHWDVLQVVPSHSPNPNGMFLKLYEEE